MNYKRPSSPQPNEEEFEIERVPWSVLGPQFIESWGRSNPKNPQPEHLEIIGQNGSGKSFLLAQIMSEMARRRKASIIFVATKAADGTIAEFDWPVVTSWNELLEVQKREEIRQFIFWPKTNETGKRRAEFQESRIQELLDELWRPEANTIIVFDEFAYIEGLSRDMKQTLNMYLREGRSHGITCVLGKQRAQGVQRDMHSETPWKIVFKITDVADAEYMSMVMGDKKKWIQVIQDLDKNNHEFIIQSRASETAYISWVDDPKPLYKPATKTEFFG